MAPSSTALVWKNRERIITKCSSTCNPFTMLSGIGILSKEKRSRSVASWASGLELDFITDGMVPSSENPSWQIRLWHFALSN